MTTPSAGKCVWPSRCWYSFGIWLDERISICFFLNQSRGEGNERRKQHWKLFKCSRTYNFKQHISEVCPCAITVSRPEPWHWYNVHNDPLVNVKILSTRTAINQVIKMCLLLAISIQKKRKSKGQRESTGERMLSQLCHQINNTCRKSKRTLSSPED